MAKALAGGGSSAATWEMHSGCERFRGTDPMVTGRSRSSLASELGAPDTSAGIPDARWTRAMIFERLCHDPAFAGEVASRATGWSGFERPTAVYREDCGVNVAKTRAALGRAAKRTASGAATLLYKLAFPYPGFDEGEATSVLPDLAVVAASPGGPMLVVGDVKDYERVRSRIDDGRLLKGFLQVAMGALAYAQWSSCPEDLQVSDHGFLAVPRSVFLQPTVEVEDLTDHLQEVKSQWRSRLDALARPTAEEATAHELVARLAPAFDPVTCPSCSLFRHCRQQLREVGTTEALLQEIGVPVDQRRSLTGLVDNGVEASAADPMQVQRVLATVTGEVGRTGQHRLDPVGRVGVVNVVAVKSDAAALGFHGIAVSRQTTDGQTDWAYNAFADPQSDVTRRTVMAKIGDAIEQAMRELRLLDPDSPLPIHVVVPDEATSNLLASTADLLAGVEISRLRWKRDKEMGRKLLTWNGEEATMPKALEGGRRVAVSFLLEQDRARMLRLREPVVNLTATMAHHFVPGGAAIQAQRLDYVVAWAEETVPVDHREVTDVVEASPHTPGARLSNASSNAIHAAMMEARTGGSSADYDALVMDELRYRTATFDRAVAALQTVPTSRIQTAYRSLEGDAQRVWRRRMKLRASDLVRFGRTYRPWRNQLVDIIGSDVACSAQFEVLTNPLAAEAAATDAGNRDVTWATVRSVQPLVLEVQSRQFGVNDRVVLVASGEGAWLESPVVEVQPQKGSIRVKNFPIGPLAAAPDECGTRHFVWEPPIDPHLSVGERVVVARLDLFDALQSNKAFNVLRPLQDVNAAPKASCTVDSYASNSADHQWCCRPHEVVEAEFADEIARRRANRELNPEVWPPVRDDDGFEVAPAGKPTSRDVEPFTATAPEGVTTDELE